MGESDLSFDSAAFISAAVFLPMVVVVAGCAICRRLCGGNEADDEEREPFLSEGRQESQTRTERVVNERASHQRRQPEGHSPKPHAGNTQNTKANTRDESEPAEDRSEDTRQQAQPGVVTAEASLIPDLLQIEEQEHEKSYQTEPNILEPNPFTERQFSEDVHEQLIKTDKQTEQLDERNDIYVKAQTPTLHPEAVEEASQSPILDQEQLVRTLTLDDNDTIQIETEPESATIPNNRDVEATAALNAEEEESKQEEVKIETQTIPRPEETSSSAQHQRVKDTGNEAASEAGDAVEEQLKQAIEPGSKADLDFDTNPTFVKTMRTNASKKHSKAIFGLTVLHNELFIISQHSSDVEVYDSRILAFKHQFHLKGLFDPVDIKSCSKNNCLYIFDWKESSSEILRFAPDGNVITKWETGLDGGYISVTREASVILSVWEKQQLKEFTADGQLLREIQLPSSISELRLAIKLSSGHFVVSHGEKEQESEHRVCLVDDKGDVIKAIGRKQGSSQGEFYGPNYMAVDGAGYVLVADQNNKRVVLLTPDLEFKREVIQEKDDLRYPVRMDLDHTSGRLFVADNDYLEDHTGWRDGRVIVFDFKIRQ